MLGRPIRRSRGSIDLVGDQGVDRRQAGSPGITQVGDLHRRGLAGEDGEPVAGGVPGQVDEDVDLVATDEFLDLPIGERTDLSPVMGYRRSLAVVASGEPTSE